MSTWCKRWKHCAKLGSSECRRASSDMDFFLSLAHEGELAAAACGVAGDMTAR